MCNHNCLNFFSKQIQVNSNTSQFCSIRNYKHIIKKHSYISYININIIHFNNSTEMNDFANKWILYINKAIAIYIALTTYLQTPNVCVDMFFGVFLHLSIFVKQVE